MIVGDKYLEIILHPLKGVSSSKTESNMANVRINFV